MAEFKDIPRFSSMFEELPKYPLLFKDGIKSWPALKRWSPEYFYSLNPEAMLTVEEYDDTSPLSYPYQSMHMRKHLTVSEIYKLIQERQFCNMTIGEYNHFFNQFNSLFQDLFYFMPFGVKKMCNSGPSSFIWWSSDKKVVDYHTDDFDLFLFQIYGSKIIRFVSPDQSDLLYKIHPDEIEQIYKSSSQFNADAVEAVTIGTEWSRVSCFSPDLEKFPLYDRVVGYECLMEAGDVVYIPQKWWHATKAREISISVNLEAFPEDIQWDLLAQM